MPGHELRRVEEAILCDGFFDDLDKKKEKKKQDKSGGQDALNTEAFSETAVQENLLRTYSIDERGSTA